MYHVYLDFGGNQRDEKTFPHFNAVQAFIASIRFPPKRIHIIFLNSH